MRDGVVLCAPECLGHPGHTPSFRPNHGSSQPLLSGIVQCMDTFKSKVGPKKVLGFFFNVEGWLIIIDPIPGPSTK